VLKLSYAERSGAGGYEQRRFEEGVRSWRRRVLPRVRWLVFPSAVVCIGYELVRPSTLDFLAGFWAGAMACLYLFARDLVPEHVQHHGDGAEGERATARELGPLRREGWYFAHDIDTGRGNRDHIAVGPGGVYLLDSKKLGGSVTVEGDIVRVERIDDPRDSYELSKLAAALRGEARRLNREIAEATGVRTWVSAVVVFWSRFEADVIEGDRIFYVHGEALAAWLRERPRRQPDAVTARIADHLG
jgi:hypothetical protein